MKEFTNVAGNVNFFFLGGSYAREHDLKGFEKFCEPIYTPKEWFLSKKGPKEDERVGRGHFHERVGETPCTLTVSKRWTYHKTFFRY